MSFAVMVYATHKNWRDTVKGDGTTPGLEQKLIEVTKLAKSYEAERTAIEIKLEHERAARRQALAALQGRKVQLDLELIRLNEQNSKLVVSEAEAQTTLKLTQTMNIDLKNEVDSLWAKIKVAQEVRDKQFSETILLTDSVQQYQNIKDRLGEKNQQLAEQIARMKKVLTAFGKDENTPVDNIPPKLDGQITDIGVNDLVEVSLGKDDGLRIGNTLDVYRGDTYIGRIEIKETSPDRSVGRILQNYRNDLIKKGDNVSTKLG
ncbi:MAG: hypothetical protein ACKVH8_01435 [Pirellulales bacterium]